MHSFTRSSLDDLARPDVQVLRLAAFAAAPGGGNPAGVVLDAHALTDQAMQEIASEVGYSETAFVTPVSEADGDSRVAVRYFSPDAEVPFCGHATVAAAVALAQHRGIGTFTFETPVGSVVVDTAYAGSSHASEHASHGAITASFTSVEPEVRELKRDVADDLLSALRLNRTDLDEHWPLREAYAGNWHPIIAVHAQHVFDAFQFDAAAVRALMDKQGWPGTVTVVCRQQANDASALHLEARNVFPVGDITEDPATGSAAAALGGYLRAIGAPELPCRIAVSQGRHVGRPSLLMVDVPKAGGITVTGTATVIRDA